MQELHRIVYKNENGEMKATARMSLDSALLFQDALKTVRGLDIAELVTLVNE